MAQGLTGSSSSLMPFVYGLRLLRQSFDEDQLFFAAVEAFRSGVPEKCAEQPLCAKQGFTKVDWEDANTKVDWEDAIEQLKRILLAVHQPQIVTRLEEGENLVGVL